MSILCPKVSSFVSDEGHKSSLADLILLQFDRPCHLFEIKSFLMLVD